MSKRGSKEFSKSINLGSSKKLREIESNISRSKRLKDSVLNKLRN